jgi:primosomal protein N' (replication factor Y)
MQKLISVALDVPINHMFDYITENQDIKVGCRVEVPFGRSKRIGIVLEVQSFKMQESAYKIKKIYKIIDDTPLLSMEIIKTCKWASAYYHHPMGQVLFNAMSPIHRKGLLSPDKKLLLDKKNIEIQLELNKEQSIVAEDIFKNIKHHQVNVLRGVTGSGKTEVYTKLATDLLQSPGQILIMVPEINLTPQTVSRFNKYLDIEPLEYHSNLTQLQKFKVWQACKEEDYLVVIGTRSSVFLPFNNLKLLIVDEEHDQSYKQSEKFKYNARDIGIVRAKYFDCPVVLGSATPSFETTHNVDIKKYNQYLLENRYFQSKLPLITIVDTSIDKPDEGISKVLRDKMKIELNKSNKVILFIGRRGFSNTVICSECKTIVKCPKCDVYMTYHKDIEKLVCHQCESTQKFESVKPCCKNISLVPLGIGTQRIENKIRNLFPDKNILRVDSDNISSKKDLKDFIKKANNNQIDIFIGTQMIVKGHDFNNVSLVGIINVDAGLYSTDFRGLEKTGQLITQVSGRAGRQKNQGNVIIQTNNPNNEMLQKILKEGYRKFSIVALKQRKLVNLPPYSHIGIIKVYSSIKQLAKVALVEAIKLRRNKSIFVYGPTSSKTAKKNNQYYYQIIVGSESSNLLSKHITKIKLYLSSIDKRIKWSIDIDPTEQ